MSLEDRWKGISETLTWNIFGGEHALVTPRFGRLRRYNFSSPSLAYNFQISRCPPGLYKLYIW